MKANSNINVRTNDEIKLQAQSIFNALGMDLSSAINVFLVKAIAVKGFPFDVRLEEPNEETYAAIAAAEKGEGMHGPFDSVEDLMEALNAED